VIKPDEIIVSKSQIGQVRFTLPVYFAHKMGIDDKSYVFSVEVNGDKVVFTKKQVYEHAKT
jgi:hypothetical protein